MCSYNAFLFSVFTKIKLNDFLNSLLWHSSILYFFINYYSNLNKSNLHDTFIVFKNSLIDKKIGNINITDELDILYDEFISDSNIYTQLINEIKVTSLIDIIYVAYGNNKYTKHYIKDFNLYFTDLKYINFIHNMIDYTDKSISICNFFSGCGRFINNIYCNNNSYYLIDNNPIISQISYFNLLIKYKTINNIKLITTNIITYESNNKYDLIIGDLPEDLRNLIYANCNSKIKSLKIRGTKSEPLIIQYITQILNKNGKAIIILSNSFLFGESNQHINTRKYLIENFEIKVVNLDNKKSILSIEKNTKSTIEFSFYDDTKVINYSLADVIKNNYSFYYYNYLKLVKNVENNNLILISDFVNITTEITNINITSEILYSYKNFLFEINHLPNINNYDYLFITKNENMYQQKFINYFLLNLFKTYNKSITKGKINQINVNYIKNLQVIIPSYEIQTKIINYYDNYKIINKQIEIQISNLESIKKHIISQTINNCKNIKLEEICTVTHTSDCINTIYINRNTNNAGCVNLTNKPEETSTNYYYLKILNTEFINEYIYFILLYFENELIKIANINKTVSISKKTLENFNIPCLNIEEQKILINKINCINETINNYLEFQQKNNIKIYIF